MRLNVEGVAVSSVGLEETLRGFLTLEASHFWLAPSNDAMRVLGAPVVAQLTTTMSLAEAQPFKRGAVDTKSISDIRCGSTF